MRRQITRCPLCDAALRITELSCVNCDTKLHGTFPPPPLARLSDEHQQFAVTFLRCRGVIRDVERAMGISYPTVRARLDSVVAALEDLLTDPAPPAADNTPAAAAVKPDTQGQRRALLQQVEDGTLAPEAAVEILLRL